MLGQSVSEMIDELNNDFCAFQVTNFLAKTGLLQDKQFCMTEKLQNFIFLYGNQEEVYTARECKFIEQVGDIYVVPEFYKKTKHGNMPCRFIAVDLSKWQDGIYNAVFFMKVIIKAFSGFSLFVIKSNEGIHLGARMFEKTEWKNCTLSKTDDLSRILDETVWENDTDNFLDFYYSVIEAIVPVPDNYIGYEEKILKIRGVQTSYTDMLYEMEHIYGESILSELERYKESFKETETLEFADILEEYVEDLRSIQSTKVNTLEMLFEAEELEKAAKKTEEQRDRDFESSVDGNGESDYAMVKELHGDPEAIIKKLKNLKGLR